MLLFLYFELCSEGGFYFTVCFPFFNFWDCLFFLCINVLPTQYFTNFICSLMILQNTQFISFYLQLLKKISCSVFSFHGVNNLFHKNPYIQITYSKTINELKYKDRLQRQIHAITQYLWTTYHIYINIAEKKITKKLRNAN